MLEINYCLSNIEPETRPLLHQPHFHPIEDFCLGRCGYCEAGAFLVVDGKVVTGESHSEIIEKLEQETGHHLLNTDH
jgi:uncharacterized protein YuzB (UPF0349 family)